jgi:hypothetical protein
MKRIAAILLSIVVIVVNGHFGLQVALYEIFKPEVIQSFCVNRDVKDSDCEARCHMSKVAAQDTGEQDKSSLPTTFKIKISEFFFENGSLLIPLEFPTQLAYKYPNAIFHELSGTYFSIDAPPEAFERT